MKFRNLITHYWTHKYQKYPSPNVVSMLVFQIFDFHSHTDRISNTDRTTTGATRVSTRWEASILKRPRKRLFGRTRHSCQRHPRRGRLQRRNSLKPFFTSASGGRSKLKNPQIRTTRDYRKFGAADLVLPHNCIPLNV